MSDAGGKTARKPRKTRKAKRPATVYDAVAGRVSANGSLHKAPRPGARASVATPKDLFLRKVNAAPEDEESYFASDNLPPDTLPNSDLLKDLHEFASHFYAKSMKAGSGGSERAFKSLDGTALLAMGILVEELARNALGDLDEADEPAPQKSNAKPRKTRGPYRKSAKVPDSEKKSRAVSRQSKEEVPAS